VALFADFPDWLMRCIDNASLQRGERSDALISWYFSIAHELAHNLGKRFWVPNICRITRR
jgi:hypothetical protein